MFAKEDTKIACKSKSCTENNALPQLEGMVKKSCIYTVGYTDAEGKTQEIQFEISHECAYGTAVRKLIGKFNEFCKENNLTLDSLTYVKRADSNE